MSAIERCPLFLSAIKRFFYETLTMISSVLKKSVRYREVSAIKHVHYREVPLYLLMNYKKMHNDFGCIKEKSMILSDTTSVKFLQI